MQETGTLNILDDESRCYNPYLARCQAENPENYVENPSRASTLKVAVYAAVVFAQKLSTQILAVGVIVHGGIVDPQGALKEIKEAAPWVISGIALGVTIIFIRDKVFEEGLFQPHIWAKVRLAANRFCNLGAYRTKTQVPKYAGVINKLLPWTAAAKIQKWNEVLNTKRGKEDFSREDSEELGEICRQAQAEREQIVEALRREHEVTRKSFAENHKAEQCVFEQFEEAWSPLIEKLDRIIEETGAHAEIRPKPTPEKETEIKKELSILEGLSEKIAQFSPETSRAVIVKGEKTHTVLFLLQLRGEFEAKLKKLEVWGATKEEKQQVSLLLQQIEDKLIEFEWKVSGVVTEEQFEELADCSSLKEKIDCLLVDEDPLVAEVVAEEALVRLIDGLIRKDLSSLDPRSKEQLPQLMTMLAEGQGITFGRETDYDTLVGDLVHRLKSVVDPKIVARIDDSAWTAYVEKELRECKEFRKALLNNIPEIERIYIETSMNFVINRYKNAQFDSGLDEELNEFLGKDPLLKKVAGDLIRRQISKNRLEKDKRSLERYSKIEETFRNEVLFIEKRSFDRQERLRQRSLKDPNVEREIREIEKTIFDKNRKERFNLFENCANLRSKAFYQTHFERLQKIEVEAKMNLVEAYRACSDPSANEGTFVDLQECGYQLQAAQQSLRSLKAYRRRAIDDKMTEICGTGLKGHFVRKWKEQRWKAEEFYAAKPGVQKRRVIEQTLRTTLSLGMRSICFFAGVAGGPVGLAFAFLSSRIVTASLDAIGHSVTNLTEWALSRVDEKSA